MVSNYMLVELQCLEVVTQWLFFTCLPDWKSDNKPKIFVASVDHGLRSESKSEVEFVKKICEMKKVKHFSLKPTTHLSNGTRKFAR